jgi:hypothetical protein
MWNSEKQHQLDDLRGRAEQGPLLPKEQQQLDELLDELEQEEWAALRPVLEAQRQEQQQLQAELDQIRAINAALSALEKRYADLLKRARAQLEGLTKERAALRAEYERVLR